MTIIGEYHDKFDLLQADWLSRNHQADLFSRIDWYEALHKECLPQNRLAIITASAEDNSAKAALFLMHNGLGKLSSLSNWYSFSHAPVFADHYDEPTQLALLRAMAATIRKKAFRLQINAIGGTHAQLLRRAFRQHGWVMEQQQSDHNHVLYVKGRSFDAYWQARPGQLKSTVKRKTKKFGVTTRIDCQFSEEAWGDYEDIYAHSWKPEEGNPRFLKTLAQNESAHGSLRLGFAFVEGQPVAAQLWTVDHHRALIHKLAYRQDAKPSSPGSILSAAMFQHVMDIDGVDLIDFGTGNDGYKADWMEDIRPCYSQEYWWPNTPMAWPYILKSRAKSWLNRQKVT